jgi:hypothetical protein
MNNEFDHDSNLPASTVVFVCACRLIIGALAFLTICFWQFEGLLLGGAR